MRRLFAPKQELLSVAFAKQTNLRNMNYMHYHNVYEVYYLVSGKRTYIMNNQAYSLQAGDVTLTKPNVMHITSGDIYSRILIYFNIDILTKHFDDSFIEQILQCFSKDCISSSAINQNKNIDKLFKTILNDYENNNQSIAVLHLAELLIELNNLPETQKTNDDLKTIPKIINDILMFVNKNLETISGLADVAQTMFISKYYLAHLFKKHMGMTVTQYILSMRITRAINLLTSTSMSIHQISTSCGFKSPAYFSLTFKKFMSVSPLEYRKLHKKT